MVRAIVVLRDGEPGDELARELQEHCKRVTAPYKFPRIVEFADELPKTASGKIKRAELRARRDPLSADAPLALRGLRGHLRRHAALADGRRRGAAGAAALRQGAARLGEHRGRASSSGASRFTGLASRPIAGPARGSSRPTAGRSSLGTLLAALAGLLYLVPAGLPGLIGARLVLGLGEGTVFTAGATWVVDLAPPERRGRVIGLYGLAVWSGLSIGPPIGELLYHAGGLRPRLGVRRRGAVPGSAGRASHPGPVPALAAGRPRAR